MTATQHRTAAGPPGEFVFGNVQAFRADPLGLVTTAARDYGDIVRFRLGPHVEHLLNHPDHAAHVFQKNRDNYDKATRSTHHISRVCGESLLTVNGEFWERQRRLLQPAFHRDSIRNFASLMADACGGMLDRWDAEQPAVATRDLSSEMMRLTYTIVARALFSTDVGRDAAQIEPAMRVLLEETFRRLQRIFSFPGWIPTPANRRFGHALAALDGIVFEIIEEHQRGGGERRDDLLTMLLEARDPESGQGLDETQLRNETVTLLIAGHETTSNALTWTFHLLATHPSIQEEVREEVSSVLGGRVPALEDIPELALTTNAIRESMRLYPPIWIMERHVVEEDVIAGYRMPKDSSVVVCPWTLHRHPEFWEAPEEFRPARFDGSPTPAYLPFGAGPRFCIGNEFALLEAKIITAMLLQRYRLKPVPGARIEPFPGITLPPRHGLPLELERLS